MGDLPWEQNFASDAPSDDVPWKQNFEQPASAPQTGAAHHEADVASAMPQAKQWVEEHPGEATVSTMVPEVPILSSALRKAGYYARGAFGEGVGDSVSDRAASIQATADALKQAREEKNPAAKIGSDVAGGLLGAATPTGAGRGIMSAVGLGGVMGGLQTLADQPIRSSWKETGDNMLRGEVAGAGTSGLLHTAFNAPAAYGKVRDYLSPEKGAVQQALKVANESKGAPGISMQEYLSNPDAHLAEVQGMKPTLGKAAGLAPDSAATEKINADLSQRAKDASTRLGQHVDEAFGQPIDANKFRQNATAIWDAKRAPLYDNAFKQPGADAIMDPALLDFINTPNGATAAQRAAHALTGNQFVPGQNPGPKVAFPFEKNNGVYTRDPAHVDPNLEFWDATKQELGKMYGDTGIDQKALARQQAWLTEKLTNQNVPYGPAYKAALDAGSHYFGEKNAFDAGTKFADLANFGTKSKPGKLNQMLDTFNQKYTPEEKEMLSLGVASDFKDNPAKMSKILGTGDTRTMDALKQVLGGNSPALGDIRLRQLQANTGIENAMGQIDKITAMKPSHTIADMGMGTAALLGGIEHGPHAIPYIIGGYLTKKYAYDLPMQKRAESLLDLVSRSKDPAVKKQLSDALVSNRLNQQVFSNIQQALEATAAAHAGSAAGTAKTGNMQPAFDTGSGSGPMQPAFKAGGGMAGKTPKPAKKINHAALASALVRKAKASHKDQSKMTEPLLDVDDNTVAHALAVSNRHI